MAANINTIEQIQIGEVACLPKNKDYRCLFVTLGIEYSLK